MIRSATWVQSVGGDQAHLPVLDVKEEWAVVESPECEPEAGTDATGFLRPHDIPVDSVPELWDLGWELVDS
ncbi:MAG: hypothetical protein RI568_15870 [Natronomonas sp.]|uniref:hypothetical protein n=1 Tax=Natronomonas sp. TaxID=2184060 RepID=UPI0028705E4F|nr:hypothetical protein [Natronomonas sp.]MDR9432159.1 hypothetical protein [Natronomonas sp.]